MPCKLTKFTRPEVLWGRAEACAVPCSVCDETLICQYFHGNLCRPGSSSLHYDPYENLLCVVCGSKAVRCCAPEATPAMYPLPLWGESSNHSAVSSAAPDLACHPRYADAMASMQTAVLQASMLGRTFVNLSCSLLPLPEESLKP